MSGEIDPYEQHIVGNGEVNADFKSTAGVWQGAAQLGEGLEKGAEKYGEAVQDTQNKLNATQGNTDITSAARDGMGAIRSRSSSFDTSQTDLNDVPEYKDLDDKLNAVIARQTNPSVIDSLTKSANTVRDNFAKTLYAKNATLQSQENRGAIMQQQTNLTALAYSNPDQIDDYLKMGQDFVDKQSSDHGLADGVASKFGEDMKQAILYRGAMGAIADDPYKAQKMVDSGKFDEMSGANMQNINSHIAGEISAREREAAKQQKASETQQKQTQLQTFHDDYFQLENGNVNYQQIQDKARTEQYTPDQADRMTKRLDSLMAGAYQGSDALARDADQRLRLPPTDPRAITDFNTLTAEYNGGKNMGLDQAHLKRFSQTYLAQGSSDQGVKTQMGALSDAAAKALIKPTQVPWGDKQGLAQWGQAINFMHNDYQTKMASGKFTSDQLLNPQSKDYIGSAISQFSRTPSGIANDAATSHFDPSAINADKTFGPPVGSNSKFTPMPVGAGANAATTGSPAMTPRVQAIVDAMSKRFAKKSGTQN